MTTKFPVFIICRDRLDCLKALIVWLESAGHDEIYLMDNDSAYEPLLKYFAETKHTVIKQGFNAGPWAAWSTGLIEKYAKGRPYVVTDPDVVPSEECPLDVLDYFHSLLEQYPEMVKIGFGLRIDDLPKHYPMRHQVLEFEEHFWQDEFAPGLYKAAVDTTFALYRADSNFALEPALRTGAPYLARHLPWYYNPASKSEEELFYRSRIEQRPISAWHSDKPHPMMEACCSYVRNIKQLKKEADNKDKEIARLSAKLEKTRRRYKWLAEQHFVKTMNKLIGKP